MTDLFSLKGRFALVTGGAGHLGSAIVEALCEAGATVAVNGRDSTKLTSFVNQMNRKGFDCFGIPGDITNHWMVKRIAAAIERRFGALNVLVNNAYSGKTGTLESASAEDFSASYAIAVTAAFSLMRACAGMLEKGARRCGADSSIVNIASMYAMVSPDLSIYRGNGHENPPFYGAAKAGLLQLTKYAACEWASRRIRVNAVSPGPFPSPGAAAKYRAMHAKLCGKTPLHRTGEAWELKGAVVFLASEASSYVTGANVVVDGGWTAW